MGIVFVGSIACRPSGDDGGVRAFDGAIGQQLWYSHLLGIGNAPRTPATSPRPRGRPAGVWPWPGASSPAVANGLVFAGLGQGIGAWRLSDGVRRWRSGTAAYGAPVVSGGRLYAATTLVGGEPVTVVDQFALGATAAG